MDIYMRLNILSENNVITQQVYDSISQIINSIKNQYGITITEENGGMLITHLSAALTRMNNGEKLNSPDESILEQLKLESTYDKAVKIKELIEDICSIKIPYEEEVFIITHLCTILN